MAAARTERLLQAVEDATAEAPAAEALHALLHATRDVPITFAQRGRAEALGGRLVRRGLLGAEHPLLRLLALRLSTHYLPGVSEFPLPATHAHDHAHAKGAGAATATAEGGAANNNADEAGAVARIPRSPPGVGGGGGPGWGFVFQPLPRGAHMLCTVTRASSRLRPVYRLHVEALRVGDEDVARHLRAILKAAGLDPCWVVGASGGGTEDDAGGGGGPAHKDRRRCLLEARRLKASPVAKTVQVTVYGLAPSSSSTSNSTGSSGGGGKNGGNVKKRSGRSGSNGGAAEEERTPVAIARLQSPAPGVLTGQATPPPEGEGEAAPPPLGMGARVCVQVSERERLLSLSAVVPVPSAGNVYTTARGVPEVLEAPLAHLTALCREKGEAAASPSHSLAFFGARSRPPRWSPLHRLHTLEFEGGAQRVREPSRKNLALMDVSHLPAATLTAHHHPPLVYKGGSGGGGVGRALSRGASSGSVVTMAAGAAEDAGWSRERGPKPVLQMGKVGDHRFSLDFRAPFSPFQALAVAIAAFEA